MSNQPRLFDDDPKSRARPRIIMRVVDAGDSGCSVSDGGSHIVVFQCGKCGHRTDWTLVKTVTEGKRGKPCPKCNSL